MSIEEKFGKHGAQLWKEFVHKERLSATQAHQFERYLLMLLEWNEHTNLTRIVDLPDVIAYHFQDSIRLADKIDFNTLKGVCDVGSGAGFPGIPLKILYPTVPFFLLEVNSKKDAFLQAVIQELGLSDCTVSSLDWRTFLRQTSFEIDLVLARASLQPEELLRMFKPTSPYKGGVLVYWASKHWQPDQTEKAYLVKKEMYHVGGQQRIYAIFSNKKDI